MSEKGMTLDNRKDIILLILYCAGKTGANCEPIRGRTRMMKLVYLFYEELGNETKLLNKLPKEQRHGFQPYHYGPFSKDVFDDIHFLSNLSLIEEDPGGDMTIAEYSESRLFYDEALLDCVGISESDMVGPEPVFFLTGKGETIAAELYNGVNPSDRKKLNAFKKRYNSIPLNSLLRYVYTRHPEAAEKSKIKGAL